MSDYCLIFISFPDQKTAEKIAKTLVDNQWAACIHILSPITSIYRWKNNTETATETQIQIKTKTHHIQTISDHIKTHHPYDVPELISIPITAGLPDYLRWIDDSLQ